MSSLISTFVGGVATEKKVDYIYNLILSQYQYNFIVATWTTQMAHKTQIENANKQCHTTEYNGIPLV
jgi:hypothetical protein